MVVASKNQVDNLVSLLDGYFAKDAHHLNVNVLQREQLLDAMKNPDKYSGPIVLRVSGYAVDFLSLTFEQKSDVLSRTFHQRL